jgi:hypothetical protein
VVLQQTDNATALPLYDDAAKACTVRKFPYIFKDLTKEVVRDSRSEHGEAGYVLCFCRNLEANLGSDVCISDPGETDFEIIV